MTAPAEMPPVLHVAEPSTGYLGRPPIVVDCSALSAALFEEESREAAWRVLSGKTLHAPLLLDCEIVSVAVKKQRAGMSDQIISRALAQYAQQEIEFHRPKVAEQHDLAVRFGVSGYDAAYLWVAGMLQAPLATFDEKLAKAARAYLGGSSGRT